jgi:hypothetical protein
MKCSKYSEVAVPMLVGSNPTEGGGFFQKEGTSAGPWMCVYVSSGLTVGWWKEDQHSFGHHRELIKKTSYLDTWRYKRFEIQTVYSSTYEYHNRADAAFVFSLDLGLPLCKYFQFFLVS